MAERQGAITPRHEEERRLGFRRPQPWGSSPFRMLQRLADDMDRMFDDFGFFRRPMAAPLWSETGADEWMPEVEVFQKNDQLTGKADLPGLKKDEISVEVSDNAITIHGERKHEHEEEREGYYRSERSYGSFRRVIPLPEGTIADQAKAQFRDGVLEITMPAPPATRGRRLEITEGAKK